MSFKKHNTCDTGDTVEYNGVHYFIEYIWNHGYSAWWFDLIAVEPDIPGIDFFGKEMSVPSYLCKLIKKK